MVAKAKEHEERLPVPPERDSVAASEVSLYRNVLKIKRDHDLQHLGISFYDCETTIQWSYNADSWFHAASTMKLAVLLGVFRQVDRGELQLDAPVHVRNRFTSIVNQEPFMLELGRDADPDVYGHLGKTLTVRELAYWMIIKSSNLATNLLVDVVGIPTIQQSLNELEIDGVKVLRGVEDSRAFDAGLNNEVTANGLLKLLRLIADGRAYSPKACEEMLEILLDQKHKSGIPAGLPKTARVAHKTGNISTVHHDAGIVYLQERKPYVLVILTAFPAEQGRGTAVAELSRDIFNSIAGSVH
ncbi:MAG TPA: serine hydrolase [Thermoanaerobaculia bacterium]|jgi:beta-lactamase class A|nr:serine hydrolase [Thermoanaerobaculia bacterium]